MHSHKAMILQAAIKKISQDFHTIKSKNIKFSRYRLYLAQSPRYPIGVDKKFNFFFWQKNNHKILFIFRCSRKPSIRYA